MSELRTDLPFAPVPLWVIELPISDRALRLYALLAAMRDYGSSQAKFGRSLLAKKLGWSLDKLDRAKAELEHYNVISVERNGQARNIYTVHRIPPWEFGHRDSAASDVAAQEQLAADQRPSCSRDSAAQDEKKENENQSYIRGRVRDTWLAEPNLIQHRDTYFTDPALRRRVIKAVTQYSLEDVLAAISAYAAVLRSDAHYFSHSWTLSDFLKRGLDRFVPEAKPLEAFRSSGKEGKVKKPRERIYTRA
jgi:hypothetical protein